MRLTRMPSRLFLAAVLAAMALLPARSQQAVPAGSGDTFKDLSPLKQAEASLPPGKRVAIYEFEDLECPACAHAFPIVHMAAERYKIPLIRHDFPLNMHVWSRDAAIIARYLQDKVSPESAEQYRREVFASQSIIATKDDLNAFTRKWFNDHKLQQPMIIDPAGLFAAEVQADSRLGERIGLLHTPTIFILYPGGWVQVTDVSQLYSVIDTALAQSAAVPPQNHMRKSGPGSR